MLLTSRQSITSKKEKALMLRRKEVKICVNL